MIDSKDSKSELIIVEREKIEKINDMLHKALFENFIEIMPDSYNETLFRDGFKNLWDKVSLIQCDIENILEK